MTDTSGPLDDLPGDLMIWVLIVSELLVIGAGLLAFLAVRLSDPAHPGIAGLTRQPLLWGLVLWSGAHLLANGDLAHALLFGSFAVFSLLGMGLVERRRARAMGAEAWQRLMARTGLIPFAALLSGRRRPRAGPPLRRVTLWLPVWAGLWLLHAPVIGVSPAP